MCERTGQTDAVTTHSLYLSRVLWSDKAAFFKGQLTEFEIIPSDVSTPHSASPRGNLSINTRCEPTMPPPTCGLVREGAFHVRRGSWNIRTSAGPVIVGSAVRARCALCTVHRVPLVGTRGRGGSLAPAARSNAPSSRPTAAIARLTTLHYAAEVLSCRPLFGSGSAEHHGTGQWATYFASRRWNFNPGWQTG